MNRQFKKFEIKNKTIYHRNLELKRSLSVTIPSNHSPPPKKNNGELLRATNYASFFRPLTCKSISAMRAQYKNLTNKEYSIYATTEPFVI